MPADPNLFTLIQFDTAAFSLIRSRIGMERRDRADELRVAETIAAYFWLSLGSDLEYFPRRYAVRLARNRFSELLNTWESFFQKHGELFVPEFLFKLETFVSRRVTVLPPPEGFDNPSALHPYFRDALAIEIESMRDDRLITSMGAVTLLKGEDLEQILEHKQPIKGQFSLIIDLSLLRNQFPAMMLHMHTLSTLSSAIEASGIAIEDRIRLKSRLQALTRWRLNFHLDTVSRFFPLIADSFYSERGEQVMIGYSEFRRWVDQTVDDWGFTHIRILRGGA
jgi:hypothetical protein